jgi:hypothetical protein
VDAEAQLRAEQVNDKSAKGSDPKGFDKARFVVEQSEKRSKGQKPDYGDQRRPPESEKQREQKGKK